MKKSYLMIATAAIAMVSCADTYELKNDLNGNNANQVAISFETFNNKATKAENSSETNQLGLIAHHSTFAVWGYKDVQSDLVFDDQLVNGTAGTAAVLYASASEYNTAKGTTLSDSEFAALTDADKTKTPAVADKWTYSPIRFWDKNSNSYEFYAAAPRTENTPKWVLNANTDVQNDDYFTLADVTLSNSTLASTSYVESMSGQSNTDYMIASPKNVALAYYSQAVQLDFNHILSRLNVTVKKGKNLDAAGDDGKLAITSFSVVNMANKGTFDESKANASSDPALSTGTVARWATPTGSLTYAGNALADVTTTASYIMQSLIMPQTVGYDNTVTKDGKYTADKKSLDADAAPYIEIVYTIGKDDPETFTAYYNLASLFGSTNLNFCEGWQNTLNITIDANAVEFNPQVFNWDDTTAGALSINK